MFVGHPHADSAMPSLVLTAPRQSRGRAAPFFEHRDALAVVPSGLREARCVLGAAPSAFARSAQGQPRAGAKQISSQWKG